MVNAERLRVLLAEDEDDDAFLIRRALGKLEVADRLVVVANGQQVIDHLNDRLQPTPDLVVLDHRMPLVSGLDVLFWMRTESDFKQMPVLVLSGEFLPLEIDIIRRLEAGVCLKKPCFREMLHSIAVGIKSAQSLAQSLLPHSFYLHAAAGAELMHEMESLFSPSAFHFVSR
jgi:two-component system, response regulator